MLKSRDSRANGAELLASRPAGAAPGERYKNQRARIWDRKPDKRWTLPVHEIAGLPYRRSKRFSSRRKQIDWEFSSCRHRRTANMCD